MAGHDLIVQRSGPPWRVSALQLKSRISVSVAVKGHTRPSKLLRTRDEVVEFTGRAEEEAEFTHWRDSDEAVLVRLLHAPGGEGKTRFARHLGRTWREEGWVTLEAQHTKDLPGGMGGMPTLGDDTTGVLIIVDYAERWPEDDLWSFIRNSMDHWKLPLRFLLLSRPAGVWWEQVEYLLDKHLDLDAEAVRLPPMGTRLKERERAFLAARDAFAARLGVSRPKSIGPPPGLISDPAYSLILTIHMAALAAVDARHRRTSAPVDPARLSSYLLQRERDHWRNLERTKRIRTDAETLESAVYAASLCGPMLLREANEVVVVMGIAGGVERVRNVVRDHSLCYPPASNGAASVLEPLQPDRLAEDFIALTLPGHDGGFAAEPWAANATTQLLRSNRKEINRSVRGALTTLIEMAARWRHIAVDHLAPFLRAHPRIVLQCGNASLVTLADNPHIGLDTLQAVAHVLRGYDGPGLGTGAAAILSRVLKLRMQEVEDPVERAALCHELTAIYQIAGLFDQGAGTARHEIALLRPLAEAEPDEYGTALADALLSLCAALAEQGNHEEAAEAAAEALRIKRTGLPVPRGSSPDDGPPKPNRGGPAPVAGPFGTALAASLVHHAEWLFHKSGNPRAIAVCGEAVKLLRRVTERGPNRRAYLARAWHSLTGFLLHTAALDAALETAKESVSAHRELFAERNSVHRAEQLVHALALLSSVQTSKGSTRAAVESANEAVSLARKVVEHDQDRTSLLAHALSTLGEGKADQYPNAAVTVSSEALRLYRSLARKHPRHRDALTASLAKHATLLLKVGQNDSALAVAREGVALVEDTAPYDKRVLPLTFGALSDAFKVSGDLDGALTTARKAVEATEELARRLPWLESELAQRQGKVADILIVKGELDASEAMSRTALRTYAGFRRAYAPLPRLDMRLRISHVRCLVASGDLKASQRGIRKAESALRRTGTVTGEDWAALLMLGALHKWAANDRAEALASALGAVLYFRSLVAERPGTKLELATALELHGRMAVEEGHKALGLRHLQEADTLLKALHRNGGNNSLVALCRLACLNSLALAYHTMGRDVEARTATREAVSLVPENDLAVAARELVVDACITFARIRLARGVSLAEAVPAVRKAQELCAAAGSAGLVEREAELADLMRQLRTRSGRR
ncbi:tetratricopeptide repeat protein [Streptomyces chartreusis]